MSYTFGKLVVYITIAETLLLISNGASAEIAPYFTQEPSDIIVQKNTPAVLNCTVDGTPRPTVTWFRNGARMALKGDTRRRILPDGSLYFAKIIHTKGNRPDEGRYQCQASSNFRSQQYTVLSRSAHLKVAGMSSKFNLEPASQRVIVGDIARLLCKLRHSIPKPKITWKFKQKGGSYTLLPSSSNNKYTLLDNGILQVRNVQSSDAGEYMCMATNSIAMRKHSSNPATLNVDKDNGNIRKSDFVAYPTNTNSTKGSRVVLECAFRGRPTPTVKWYKRSQLITYNDRVKLLGESNLEISNITLDDEGEYQCEGSVSGRRIYKVVLLQVHYPPTFISKPQNKKARIEDNVTFKCVVDGRPLPKVKWIKNGLEILSSDFIIFTPGSITVESLVSSDTGIYQCIASNYLGEVQAPAELSVFEKDIYIPTLPHTTTEQPTTHIRTTTPIQLTTPPSMLPGKPRNVQTKTLSATEIKVSWDPPLQTFGKVRSYHIFFTYAERGGGVAALKNTTKTSLIFKGLKPNTKFKFRVYAKNSYGTGPISPDAIGRTANAGKPPGMPTSLVAVAKSSSQIKVQWTEPQSEKPITGYYVEYQEISQTSTPKLDTVTTNRQVTLRHMKTYTPYKISVYAVNKYNAKSQPAITTATTLGGVPKGKPRDLVARGDGTGTGLVVTWKPLDHSLANGRITKYLLEYRKKNRKNIRKVDLPDFPLTYKLTRLKRNTVYEVRMSAGTDSGFGDFTHWVQGNTSVVKCSESKNPGQPTDLHLSIITVKSRSMIKVEWQAPVDVSQVCVTGYTIEHGEGTPFHQKERVNASTTQFLAKKGISSGRTYVVKVTAVNSKNDNGPNIQDEIDIPHGTAEKKPVKQVRVTPLSSRSLKVAWVDDDGISVVYHVYHNLKKTMVYCGNTTSRTIVCRGLKPYTFYTVIVRRHGENVNETGTNRTLEEKPSPPTDITGSQAEDNTTDLYLHWQVPEEINGMILEYRIHYTTNLSFPLSDWTTIDCNGSAMMTRVKGLVPDKKYYFKMQVKNGAGWSDTSKAKMIMIQGEDSPTKGPPGNVDAHASGGDQLRDKTLWIVIAAVAGITLIAIIVISVVLCKKRSGEDQSPRKARKPPPSYKSAVMANGSVKKKEEKPPDLWINHTENMEMKPLKPTTDVANIPRSSREMKPLDEHPIDQIQLDHERSSFRKGSLEMEPDELPPPPLHLLDQNEYDIPSPIAIPNRYRPVVNYARPASVDNVPRYPAYPLTSTPRHVNAFQRSESFDNSKEPDSSTPFLRAHSDDIDHHPKDNTPAPIYAVPTPKPKPKPPKDEPTYKVPPPTMPKPTIGPADNIQLPSVGYNTPNGGYRVPVVTRTATPEYDDSYTPQRKDTRAVAAELDQEIAGLEGLMRDLSDITSNDYLT